MADALSSLGRRTRIALLAALAVAAVAVVGWAFLSNDARAANLPVDKTKVSAVTKQDMPAIWVPTAGDAKMVFYGKVDPTLELGITEVSANLRLDDNDSILKAFGVITPDPKSGLPNEYTYPITLSKDLKLEDGAYNIKFSVTVCDPPGDKSNGRANCVAQTVKKTFTVYNDVKKPEVVQNSPTPGTCAVLKGTDKIKLTATDDVGISRLIVHIVGKDGTKYYQDQNKVGGVTPFSYDVDLSKLPEGQYTAQWSAYDTSGNTAQNVPSCFTIDNTGPVVTQEDPQIDGTTCGTFKPTDKIELKATDDVGLGRMIVHITSEDGKTQYFKQDHAIKGSPTTYTYSVDLSNLPAGKYTAKWSAYDTAGNPGNIVVSCFTVKTDWVKPVVTQIDPEPGEKGVCGALSPKDTITLEATDETELASVVVHILDAKGNAVKDANGKVIKTYWDTVPVQPGGAKDFVHKIPLSDLPDGSYTAKWSAYDKAGNSADVKVYCFTITSDQTRPVIEQVSPVLPAANVCSTVSPSQTVALKVTDNVDIAKVVLHVYVKDGAKETPFGAGKNSTYWRTITLDPPAKDQFEVPSFDLSGLPDGAYLAKWNAYDSAGKLSNTIKWCFTVASSVVEPPAPADIKLAADQVDFTPAKCDGETAVPASVSVANLPADVPADAVTFSLVSDTDTVTLVPGDPATTLEPGDYVVRAWVSDASQYALSDRSSWPTQDESQLWVAKDSTLLDCSTVTPPPNKPTTPEPVASETAEPSPTPTVSDSPAPTVTPDPTVSPDPSTSPQASAPTGQSAVQNKPKVGVSITVNGKKSVTVPAGATLSWVVTLSNTGKVAIDGGDTLATLSASLDSMARGAVLIDNPKVVTAAGTASAFSFVSRPATTGLDFQSNVVRWSGALKPGESVSIGYKAKALPDSIRTAGAITLRVDGTVVDSAGNVLDSATEDSAAVLFTSQNGSDFGSDNESGDTGSDDAVAGSGSGSGAASGSGGTVGAEYAADTQNGGLAMTGFESAMVALVALALLGAGGAVLWLRRRTQAEAGGGPRHLAG